jgi:hypothetical protein
MREVNAAWHVLRDPGRRLAHDRELGIDHGPRYAAAAPPDAAADERAVPLAEQLDDETLVAAPGRLGDLLLLVPAGLLAAAVGCFAVGTLMLNASLFVAAVGLLVLSGAAFVVAPFVTLARDRRRGGRLSR